MDPPWVGVQSLSLAVDAVGGFLRPPPIEWWGAEVSPKSLDPSHMPFTQPELTTDQTQIPSSSPP